MKKFLGGIASFLHLVGELTLASMKHAARLFRRLTRRIRKGDSRAIWACCAVSLAVVMLVVILVAPGAGAVGADVSANAISETPIPGGADDPFTPAPSLAEGDGLFPLPSPSPDQQEEPAPSPILSPTPSPTLPPTPTPEPELKLKYGMTDPRVSDLQARLMELGYMDSDETTEYFGSMTKTAVLRFQRQHELDQDGIVGQLTWDAIMADGAQKYALMNGTSGEDVKEAQLRLYELGYLASSGQITGYFGDLTEEAVKKLQELNRIRVDGKVGAETFNLLYSDSVTPNYYSYGEESEVVKKYQTKLKNLGYLTTEPDGKYGKDTLAAIRQFQSRNNLVVDGYLGPSTRKALDSSSARPNAISLGDSGAAVTRVQNLLYEYNYLKKSHVTGYFGEITEAAVKQFQKNNRLSVDGDVGKRTMNALTGDNVVKASRPVTSSSGSGGSSSGGSSGSGSTSSGVQKLIEVAKSKLGTRYVTGGKGPNKFDCSGFVYWCLNQVGVKQSYLTSYGWRSIGKYTKITRFEDIRAGDIIVVKGHVAIAISKTQIIDASSSNGKVVQRSFQSNWWKRNFICAWRIFD
jgi:peptidoglycan hydrolase-like protein with peptidoglycan-binding domain